jgi:hypothetical protein
MKTLMSRWLMHSGLLLLSVLVTIMICESLLRIFDISYPVFDDYDETRGIRLKPGKEGWYRGEGEAYLSINSLGYRDREHDRVKPENTFRIAVLGDSFVEARQVSLEDTFWYRLGSQLQTCSSLGERRVEILSFGIGGYNTLQEYLTLQKDVRLFAPDLVLLAVFAGNDIQGNSTKLQQGDAWRIPTPTYTLVDGELVPSTSFKHSRWQKLLYTLTQHSRVFELINEGRRTVRWQWKSSDPGDPELGLSAEVYAAPESPNWSEAWHIMDMLLAKMNDMAKRMGARFVVTTIPRAIDVYPLVESRKQFEERIGVRDLFYPDERINRIGVDHGFRVYPLTKELQGMAEQRKIYLHGFRNTTLGRGHLNSQGHKLVAELLAAKLCNPGDLGLSDQRTADSH